VSSPTASRQRFWIRATLVAAMLLAAIGLVAMVAAKAGGGASGPASLARTSTSRTPRSGGSLRVRVVDAEGHVVRGARVFVDTSGGAQPAQARWSPAHGVLMLPRRAHPHDLRVLARGFRVQDVAGVDGDRTIVLKRGYRLRVHVRDAPTDGLPSHVGIMLRVRPLDAPPEGDRPATGMRLDTATLIDLMDDAGRSGVRRTTRQDEFGYPLSLTQAARGILLPRAGRYHVRWGLLDLRGDTWFSVGPRCGRDIVVAEGEDPTNAHLTILAEDVQATLEGLPAKVAQAKAAQAKAGR